MPPSHQQINIQALLLDLAKFITPLAIALIGWYISSMLVPINQRLDIIEKQLEIHTSELKVITAYITTDKILRDGLSEKVKLLENKIYILNDWTGEHELHHAKEKHGTGDTYE